MLLLFIACYPSKFLCEKLFLVITNSVQCLKCFDFLSQVFGDFAVITDPKMLENKVQEFNNEVTKLWDNLMGFELQLVDQLEVMRDVKPSDWHPRTKTLTK